MRQRTEIALLRIAGRSPTTGSNRALSLAVERRSLHRMLPSLVQQLSERRAPQHVND